VSLSLCVSMYMCDAVLGGEVDHPQRWLQKEIEIIGCRPGRVNVRCVCVCVRVCVYTLSQMAAKMEKACRDSCAVRYVCALHALNKSKIKHFTHLKHFTHITYFTHQIFPTSNISHIKYFKRIKYSTQMKYFTHKHPYSRVLSVTCPWIT